MFRDKLLNQCFLASVLINSLGVCVVGHAQLARRVTLLAGADTPTSNTRSAALHPIRVGLYHPPVVPKLVAATDARQHNPGNLPPSASVPGAASSPLENLTAANASASVTAQGDERAPAASSNNNDNADAAALRQTERLAAQAMANAGRAGTEDEADATHAGETRSSAAPGPTSTSDESGSDSATDGSRRGSGDHAVSGRGHQPTGSPTGNPAILHDGAAGHGAAANSDKSNATATTRLALNDVNSNSDKRDVTDDSNSTADDQAAGDQTATNAATAKASPTIAPANAANPQPGANQGAKSDTSITAKKSGLTRGIRLTSQTLAATKTGASLPKTNTHPMRTQPATAAANLPAVSHAIVPETSAAQIKVVTSDAAQDNAAEAAMEQESATEAQSPEKGLGPTTYVVPKIAKMWTIPPAQKFVLPTDLKLALPADMPVVPGIKPLTREQIEQLRQLLHQHNLQHMQGLTREQLKKLLEARKDAERPTSDQATANPIEALPDQPDDTLKPRRPARPRLAAANDALALPPGLTSPFKYKPWSPAWREHYAMFVQQTPLDNTLVDPATGLLPPSTALAANPAAATQPHPPLLAALPADATRASTTTTPGSNQSGANDQPQGNAPSPTDGQAASPVPSLQSQNNPMPKSDGAAGTANAPAPGNARPGATLLGTGQAGATTATTAPPATGATGSGAPPAASNNAQTPGGPVPNAEAVGSAHSPNSQVTGQTGSGQSAPNPAPGDGQANGAPPITPPDAGQVGTSAANNNTTTNHQTGAGVLGTGQATSDTPTTGQTPQSGTNAAQSGPAPTGNSVLGSGTGQAANPPATGAAGTGVLGSGAGQANAGQANAGQANAGQANAGQANAGQANAGQANAGVLGSGNTQSGTGQAGTTPGTGLLGSGTHQTGSTQANTDAPGTTPPGAGVLGAGQPATGQIATGQPATGQTATGQQNTGPIGTGVLGAGTPGTNAPGTATPGTGPVGAEAQGTAGPGVLGTGPAAPGQNDAGQNGTGPASSAPPGTGPADAVPGADVGDADQGDMGGEAFVDNEGIAADESTPEAINPDAAGFTPAEGVQPNMPPHNHDLQKGIPGALVLPPLPPIGTEVGTNSTLRTVKPATRLVAPAPPQFENPPPGAPTTATQARPRASQAHQALLAQAGGEKPRRLVPKPVLSKPASAPHPASPKPVPQAISFGSTSENGTIIMPVAKNPLALGLVPATDFTANVTAVRAPALLHPSRAATRSPRQITATAPPSPRKLGVEGQATPPQASSQLAPTKPTLAHRARGQAAPLERSDDATVPEALPHQQSKNSQGIKEGAKNPLPPTPLPDSDAEIGDGSGLKGDYYLGRNFDQYQFTRADPNIDFVWSTDANPSPNPRLPEYADYSARWTGKLQPRYSEDYTIYAAADDGVRVWIDHKLLIDAWAIHGVLEYSAKIKLEAGKQYDIRVDYFQSNGGGSSVSVYWESQSQQKEDIPEECLFYPLAGDKEALDLDEKPHLVPIDKY